ncbi:unnamed protein product, partial [Rotaria magnacalcarata]
RSLRVPTQELVKNEKLRVLSSASNDGLSVLDLFCYSAFIRTSSEPSIQSEVLLSSRTNDRDIHCPLVHRYSSSLQSFSSSCQQCSSSISLSTQSICPLQISL